MDADTVTAAARIESWPDESREAAQLVIDRYGEPQEVTDARLIWNGVGPWKRVVATREWYEHRFPVPHIDAVESTIRYDVPADKFSELTAFDGSVVVERTAGEVSARCHDLEANSLALNLMHDVVTGAKTAEDAREYYAKEFLDHRRGRPTPYMDKLRVPVAEQSGDPDRRVLTDDQLQAAEAQGAGS
jgi:hypothetical protein